MPWQVSIALSNLFAALRAIEARKLGKSKTDFTLFVMLFSFFCVFVTGLVFVFVTSGDIEAHKVWNEKSFFILMAVGIGLENLLTIRLFRMLPASLAILLLLLNPISVLLLANIFLGETMSVVQWLGASLVLCSVAAVFLIKSTREQKAKTLPVRKGLYLALLTSVIYAVAITTEKYLLDAVGVDTYLIFGWGLQFIAAIGIALVYRKSFRVPKLATHMFSAIKYGVLLAAAGILYIHTQVSNDSASLTVISSTAKVSLTVLLAFFILKEHRFLRIKILSILLSTAGLTLLFL